MSGKPIDLTGQVFNFLTVLKYDHSSRDGANWLCQCVCGNTKVVAGATLRRGHISSCGCKRKESLIGERFGRLVVIDKAENKGKQTMWLCQCDCGNTKVTSRDCLKKGKSVSCKCYSNELLSKRVIERNAKNPCLGAPRSVVNGYKKGAIDRKLTWSISDEEALELFQQNCVYCGIGPSNICKTYSKNFIYNGIDRVDNTKGYEKENLVTCCKICNYAKHNMPLEDFLAWVDRLVANRLKQQKVPNDYSFVRAD